MNKVEWTELAQYLGDILSSIQETTQATGNPTQDGIDEDVQRLKKWVFLMLLPPFLCFFMLILVVLEPWILSLLKCRR
jgi:hypothetical protein